MTVHDVTVQISQECQTFDFEMTILTIFYLILKCCLRNIFTETIGVLIKGKGKEK
jgi:hypothetical protein